MNRVTFMLVAIATVTVSAACTKKDFNAISGTTDFDSVAVSISPTSYVVHVVRNPADTVPGNPDGLPFYVPADSTELVLTATLEPQGTAIANASTNATFSFSPAIADINGSGFVEGDSLGTSTLTATYTDVDHGFKTTTTTAAVTVLLAAP